MNTTSYLGCLLIFIASQLPLFPQADDAAERARRYAREGLKAALEELQLSAGPDQRVTARASILGNEVVRPQLTGVWQSWEIDPNHPPVPEDYSTGKDSKFLKWLVSHSDSEATSGISFPSTLPGDSVELMGEGTLGPLINTGDAVRGSRVPASTPAGRYAWAILDEGVKARINTPLIGGINSIAEATMELGSGERARVEFISELSNLQEDWFEVGSPVFRDLSEVFDSEGFASKLDGYAPGISSQLKPLTHDVSYYSMGLFCNVARGGLKRDFHLMTVIDGLPPEYRYQGVYDSVLGLPGEASDPKWQYLADFANLRAGQDLETGMPTVSTDVPGYTPYSEYPIRAVIGHPEGGVKLLPTIARIQFVFGLHADVITAADRELDPTIDFSHTHRLNLTYKPLITIHNPYNVALEFDDLKISFRDLPFAVQFGVNGTYKTPGLVPFDAISRSFFEFILNTESIGGRLQPGEVRIFDAESYLEEDTVQGLKQIEMTPNIDHFGGAYRIERLLRSPGESYVEFGSNDRITVLVAPRAVPQWSDNRFTVIMELNDGRKAGVIEMDYQTPTGIEESIKEIDEGVEFPLGETDLNEAYQGNLLINASNHDEQIALAVLGFQARTTALNDFFSPASYPGKPWAYAHATTGIASHRFDQSHPGDHAHEFSLDLINVIEEAPIGYDFSGRGYFISGDTAEYGVTMGLLYDIPLTPIQNFSSLNGADPTGVSGFLPRIAQPIGNSWAHPLISGNKFRESTEAQDSDYLDHSFLLNLALYDHFYFSGFADRDGAYFDLPRSTYELMQSFSEGDPLDDPRILLYRPNGNKASDLMNLNEASPSEEAYSRVAAWQMMQGAFNVNSTSVEAWKAMLASVHDNNAIYSDLSASDILPLRNKSSNEARMSRFRLPGSESFEESRQPEAYWLGPREYSEAELENLAEAIVAQIRERGPFLSMGDFVNRQLTHEPEFAVAGALQRAIDVSEINDDLAMFAYAGYHIDGSHISDNPYYKFHEAAAGPSYQGAPGALSQADILAVLGNAATVRSDTFTIRAYGETRDSSGTIMEKAWCEAVVQRVPDWINPVDDAALDPDELTSEMNRTHGRKFRLITFRWLQPDEV